MSAFTFSNQLSLHSGIINKIVCAPELNLWATCGGDGNIKFFDTHNHEVMNTINTHDHWVDDISFSEDTLSFYSTGRDEEIKVWRSVDLSCLYQFSLKTFGPKPLSPDGELILVRKNKRILSIHRSIDGTAVCDIPIHPNTITNYELSSQSKFLLTSHTDGSIRIWSPWTGELIMTLVAEFQDISFIKISKGLDLICAGSTNGQINVWITGEQKLYLKSHVCNFKITSIEFSPDNQFLIIGDMRGDLNVISLQKHEIIFQDGRHGSGISTISCHPSKNQFLTGSSDGTVNIYFFENINNHSHFISKPDESISKVEDDFFSSAKLKELLHKAQPLTPASKKFDIISKSTSVLTNRITPSRSGDTPSSSVITSFEDSTPKKANIEWQIGDPIDEMLNIFGFAKGGMGHVYFLRHRAWKIKLAMKSPIFEEEDKEFTMQRFIREATTWISLGNHPNIATCYFVKKIDGMPRIFIEYVDNGSLYDWIYQGKLNSIETVIKFAIQFCQGMEYAHRRGVIHRDIKPSNCLIDQTGSLKITDFGLVKTSAHHEEPIKRSIESLRKKIRQDITTDNTAMGTPEYMAPEQWESSHEVGPESDIYSFGIMLFEMACGRRPFLKSDEDAMYKMLQMHSSVEPPNPSYFLKKFPPALKSIILKCIKKNMVARYQNFNDILFDLKKIAKNEQHKSNFDDYKINTHINPETRNNYSISLLELGFFKEADDMLQKAFTAYPDSFPIAFNYYFRQWKNKKINDLYLYSFLKNFYEKLPEHAPTIQIYCLMSIYYGKYQECLDIIERFTEYKSAFYLLNLKAICLLMLNQKEEGTKFFALAAQVAPPGPEILLTFASIFFFQNDRDNAKRLFDQVCTKYPNTYKTADPLGVNSEYQVMKNLLTSFYPGPPFVVKDTLATNINKKGLAHFSSNNRWIIWVDQSNVLQIFDQRESKVVNTYQPKKEIVDTKIFNFFEQFVVVYKDAIEVLDLNTCKISHKKNAPAAILKTLVSRKDRYLTFLLEDNSIWAIDLSIKDGKEFIKKFDHLINDFCMSFQENYLALLHPNKIIILLTNGLQDFIEIENKENYSAISFLDDSKIIVSGKNVEINVYDLLIGESIESYPGILSNCTEIIPSLKENQAFASHFICTFESGEISLWNRKKEFCLSTQKLPEFNKLIINPNNNFFLAVTNDYTLLTGSYFFSEMPLVEYIYCRPHADQSENIPENEFQVLINEARNYLQTNQKEDAYIAIKDALAINGFDKSQKALDLLYSLNPMTTLTALTGCWYKYHIPETNLTPIKNIADGEKLFIHKQSYTIEWDLKTRDSKNQEQIFPAWVTKAHPVNRKNNQFIFKSKSQKVYFWNKGYESEDFNKKYARGTIISFAALDLKNVVILDNTGQLKIIDLDNQKVLLVEEFGKSARSVEFYATGQNLLIIHENFLQIFSIRQRKIIRNFKGSVAPIQLCATANKGRFLAQTNLDGNTSVWNVFKKELVTKIPFDTQISCLEFSPNPNYITIGDTGGYCSIIDIHTNTILYRFQALHSKISTILFTDNGRFMVISGYDDDPRTAVYELNWNLSFKQ